MPGSLSNEDEGQDDMDFEDDMPGEGRGGRGVLHIILRRYALNAGKRARPAARSPEEEGGVPPAQSRSYHGPFLHVCARGARGVQGADAVRA